MKTGVFIISFARVGAFCKESPIVGQVQGIVPGKLEQGGVKIDLACIALDSQPLLADCQGDSG